MVLAEVISIFIGMVVIVITTILGVKFTRQEAKIDVRPNAPKLRISALRIKPFTNNYTSGTIKDQLERMNGTTYISFYPDDVEQGETVSRPDKQSFIVKTEYIRREAEGEDKSRRQTVIILPRSKADLPRKLRSTIEGDELTKEGQIAFIESIMAERIIAGDEAIKELMSKWTRTGITKAMLKEIENEYKKLRSLTPVQQESTKEHKP